MTEPDQPTQVPGQETPVDPNIQIKFTVIFGILAFIPFVLFYFYGLERKDDARKDETAVPNVHFREITAESGITFVHENGAAGEKLLPETMGGGCAFFDFDGDGDQDLLFVNSMEWPWTTNKPTATHALYANDGKGKFTDVTAGSGLDFSSYGMGVAVGDYNADARPDVLLTGLDGNRLLANRGEGKFEDITHSAGLATDAPSWSTSAAWIDYDRDGDLDLFVCNYVKWSREIDLQLDYKLPGIGRAYGPPMNFAGTLPQLYRNDGGRFTDVSEAAGVQVRNKATGAPLAKSLGVAPVDLDRDGWLDLVVANDTVQNFVFHNNQNGTFSEVGGKAGLAYDKFGSTRGAMGIDAARFHNDDTLAISIGNFANESTAFYVAQEDPLLFTDEALDAGIAAPTRNLLTFGVFFFDYDLNGYPDLLTANGHIEPEIARVYPAQSYRQPPQLFWNGGGENSRARFIPVPPVAAGSELYEPSAGRGSAFADIDGDGDLDFVITQIGDRPRLFRNEQELGQNWLRLKLVGAKAPDAIGAWVRVRVGRKVFSQQVMPTRGYLSQSELPVTIGLGFATKPNDVQITWADGTRQEKVAVQVNALTVIRQPGSNN